MLKVGTILLAIGLIFAGVYGLLLVFSPATLLSSTLEARGETYEAVKATESGKAFIMQTRHLGVLGFCTVIAMFFVLFTTFNKGVQWAWWAFLLVGGIAWIFGLVLQILEGDMLNMILHIIGVVLLAFGLLLPMREIFAKKA
ncbi:MAG: hypothetical protein GTO17_04230 [Candidatus Aminicenantes bacterium]|nr:hypothetical protein [Candidatus Aminicenantes bacterium]